MPPSRSESPKAEDNASAALLDSSKPHMGDPPEVRTTVLVSLGVSFFYISVSAAMVFMNKALSYTYHFKATNLLLLMQMLFQVAALKAAKSLTRSGRDDSSRSLVDFTPFMWSKAKRIVPVSICYSLNSAFALAALREMSVPSYSMIKRLAPLVSLALEYGMLGKKPAPLVVASLLVMASGTILVAQADVKSSVLGWILGCGSNILQGCYLVLASRVMKGMTSLSVLYYHSILSIPCMFVLVLSVGELETVNRFLTTEKALWARPDFMGVLLATLSMGLLLNYALFLCTEKTSATSTLVAGQFKAIAQMVVGLFTFGGVEVNSRFATGLAANVVGGGGYAWAKYRVLQTK